MSNPSHVRCVLAVNDLELSTRFYVDKLGLTVDFEFEEGWSFLSRGAFSVMLGHCPDPETPPAAELGNHNYYAYVNVDDVDALYEEYKSKDVPIINDLASKPWKQREFGISTPDGHRIMFGQTID